jgi:general stress protein YciG
MTETKRPRGFAAMDRRRQAAIAVMGGKEAHRKGTAHQFTADEAREAGRKVGNARVYTEQDLRHIVGAVNAHDALVAALDELSAEPCWVFHDGAFVCRTCKTKASDPTTIKHEQFCVRFRVDAALALAKGATE